MPKNQRIRDPLHNLVEFDTGEFEQACWKALNTRPMQRLRRIKQLGFSEFVYPSASHSRFAHSVGVFHTARQLMEVVKRRLGEQRYDPAEARLAMAAALVHDVGHGPFSHAFEDALKRVGISKRHELRTSEILTQTDVIEAFDDFPDFPKRIGQLIEAPYPKDVYASIVSSQFDADRLDYMRRDRLMSGTQLSGIDFGWLIANLQVRKIPIDVDGENLARVDALVIDEKSIVAAENYVFSLLYLYINVYFHKTTRGLEKLFSMLIELVAKEVRDSGDLKVGLPANHPLVIFFKNPDSISAFLELDDSVVLGALPMLAISRNPSIAELANRIRDRKIYACVDVDKKVSAKFGLPKGIEVDPNEGRIRAAEVAKRVARVGELAKERGLLQLGKNGLATIIEDSAPRSPYKRESDSSRALSRIHVIGSDNELYDLADLSPAVNALTDYKAYRIYGRSSEDIENINQLIEDACNE